jgi:GLPGLI family protein
MLLSFLNNPSLEGEFKSTMQQETYGMSYLATITPFADRDVQRQFYQVVYIKGDSTITQTYNQRKLDSISSLRKPTAEERNTYYAKQSFAIEIYRDSLTFSEKLDGDRHIYKEQIDYDWQLTNDSRVIKGYECKKATLQYGGRNWTAWYAPDMPINAGPYKFKSLPGLIIKMTDAEHLFDFEIALFMKVGDRRMTRFKELNSEFKPLLTTRADFNKFNATYKSLSLNESMNYLNRDQPGTVQLMLTNTQGEPMNDINMDETYEHNFMELVED